MKKVLYLLIILSLFGCNKIKPGSNDDNQDNSDPFENYTIIDTETTVLSTAKTDFISLYDGKLYYGWSTGNIWSQPLAGGEKKAHTYGANLCFVQDNKIYASDETYQEINGSRVTVQSLKSYPFDAVAMSPLVNWQKNSVAKVALTYYNGYLYWLEAIKPESGVSDDKGSAKLMRSKTTLSTDAAPEKNLLPEQSFSFKSTMIYDSPYFYIAEMDTGAIYKIDPETKQVTTLVTIPNVFQTDDNVYDKTLQVATTANYLYVMRTDLDGLIYTNGMLYQINKNTGVMQTITTEIYASRYMRRFMTTDNDAVYWWSSKDSFKRYADATATITEVTNETNAAYYVDDMRSDGTYIYTAHSQGIKRVLITGGSLEFIYQDPNFYNINPVIYHIDDTYVYYAIDLNIGDGLYKINKTSVAIELITENVIKSSRGELIQVDNFYYVTGSYSLMKIPVQGNTPGTVVFQQQVEPGFKHSKLLKDTNGYYSVYVKSDKENPENNATKIYHYPLGQTSGTELATLNAECSSFALHGDYIYAINKDIIRINKTTGANEIFIPLEDGRTNYFYMFIFGDSMYYTGYELVRTYDFNTDKTRDLKNMYDPDFIYVDGDSIYYKDRSGSARFYHYSIETAEWSVIHDDKKVYYITGDENYIYYTTDDGIIRMNKL